MTLTKSVKKAAIAGSVALLPLMALAADVLDVHDGGSVTAKISIKDPTRIRVDGARITDVLGSSIRTDKNPMGAITVSVDETKGEIYLQPSNAKAIPPATSIFVSTDSATYTVILVPVDIPAETVVLRDRAVALAPMPGKRLPTHERELIVMLKAVAAGQVPAGMQQVDVRMPIALWREARFTLTRRYEGHPRWVIEVFDLTNITASPMVLDEREFLTGGVAAVALEQTIVSPGETVPVRIVREARQ